MRRPGAKEERWRDEFANRRNPAKMPGGHLDSDCKENPLFRQEFLGLQRSAWAILCAKPLRTLGFQSTGKDQ